MIKKDKKMNAQDVKDLTELRDKILSLREMLITAEPLETYKGDPFFYVGKYHVYLRQRLREKFPHMYAIEEIVKVFDDGLEGFLMEQIKIMSGGKV